MIREFDTNRFDLLDTPRVHITGHRYGHDDGGDLDVWTVKEDAGTAFVRQITVHGEVSPRTQGVYSLACFFLREKHSGRDFFLEKSARGFSLASDEFFGAESYLGAEAERVDAWLSRSGAPRPTATTEPPPGRVRH